MLTLQGVRCAVNLLTTGTNFVFLFGCVPIVFITILVRGMFQGVEGNDLKKNEHKPCSIVTDHCGIVAQRLILTCTCVRNRFVTRQILNHRVRKFRIIQQL